MKLGFCAALAAAAVAVVATAPAVAGPINAPVPVTNFIHYGGLDWAWASPCAAYGPSCSGVDMSYQSTQGWRFPTFAEFAARPEVSDFGGACASAWFDKVYSHCDFGDPDYPFGAIAGVKPHGYLFDYGYNVTAFGTSSVADSWVVRGAQVPEPASWALMIGGLGLAGAALRRRRATSVA